LLRTHPNFGKHLILKGVPKLLIYLNVNFNLRSMFETSLDLLYCVLSIATATVAIFLVWLLYQAARFVKNANNIVETVTEKLELINEGVQYMQKKMDKMSDHVGTVGKVMGTVVEKFVMKKISSKLDDTLEKRKKKTVKKRKTTKKK